MSLWLEFKKGVWVGSAYPLLVNPMGWVRFRFRLFFCGPGLVLVPAPAPLLFQNWGRKIGILLRSGERRRDRVLILVQETRVSSTG